MAKKSNHKHDYELVEMKEKLWFTHEKKCKICGHINNQIRIEKESEEVDEFLTPELLSNVFSNAGFDIELKDEYK